MSGDIRAWRTSVLDSVRRGATRRATSVLDVPGMGRAAIRGGIHERRHTYVLRRGRRRPVPAPACRDEGLVPVQHPGRRVLVRAGRPRRGRRHRARLRRRLHDGHEQRRLRASGARRAEPNHCPPAGKGADRRRSRHVSAVRTALPLGAPFSGAPGRYAEGRAPTAGAEKEDGVTQDTVSILEGSTFVVSDLRGNIDASPTDTHGLFDWDTRFLSRWVLRIDGVIPNALSTDDLQYYAAQFFLVPGTGTVYVDASLSFIRRRFVAHGLTEDLTILNHGAAPVDLDVRID